MKNKKQKTFRNEISFKFRLLRLIPLFIAIMYISYILISLKYSPDTGEYIILLVGILATITITGVFYVEFNEEDENIKNNIALVLFSIVSILFMAWAKINNIIYYQHSFLNKLNKAFEATLNVLIPIVIVCLLIFFAFLALIALTNFMKWVIWYDNHSKFIALTKKGNIKRFNSIESIQNKMDEDENIDDVLRELVEHEEEIKKYKKYKIFW